MADTVKPISVSAGGDGGGGGGGGGEVTQTPASPKSGPKFQVPAVAIASSSPASSSNAVPISPPASGPPSAEYSSTEIGGEAGGGGKKNHRLHRAEREADFIRMLVRGDFAALHALYESVDTGSEATVLVDASVHYFYTKGPNAQLLLELLKSLIDKEVDSTASPATLFRSNSAAAKMLSATLQHVGTKYLQMTLRRIVHEVCISNPRLEIDPLKLKPEDNYDENLKRMTSFCELFFNTIIKSIEDCPVFVRHVCEYVQMSAVRKFPDSKQIRQNLSAVGGLLFLRFFCPAIFTPHKFAVVEAAPGPVALRSLILISKVMQMMANGLRFSDKAEQYMIPMNEFIDKHSADLLNFFNEASTVPSEEEIARLEQKQRQAFQERVLKDISNPLLVKTNDRISQMQDWKNNVALLSPRGRSRAGTIESRAGGMSTSSGPTSTVPSSFVPSGLVARSAPDLVREMSDDAAGEVPRSATQQQLPLDREHSREEATSRGTTAEDAEHQQTAAKRPEANASVPPAAASVGVHAAFAHGGSGESHPRRDEREQRADWLDIIHFYLHRNLDKIRVLMQAPELHEDLRHLEKVLSAWTVPEIETEEQKRDKERKERERKEKLKEKEQQERRERELIELPPAKDSPKEKDRETALEKATRRLLHKKGKNKELTESNSDFFNLEEGEDFERLVVRLKQERDKEEEQRKHVEKEKENLKKAKEMIEKELIALIEDSKKMRVEIAKLQKDKEMVDYWRGEAEKEKAKSVVMLEEKYQLVAKLARQSDDKSALDSERSRLDSEREQMARERRESDKRIKQLEDALKNMTEERDELKETYKVYDARMKAEERERAKKVRERLAHDDGSGGFSVVEDYDTSTSSSSSHSISSSLSMPDRAKAIDKKERNRKKSGEGGGGEEGEGDEAAERKKDRKKKRRTLHVLRSSSEQHDKSASSTGNTTPTKDSQDKKEKEKKDADRKEKKKRERDDDKKATTGESAEALDESSTAISSSISSKSSKNTKTKKEKEKKDADRKEKETAALEDVGDSKSEPKGDKEANREKRRSKRANRSSVKKGKDELDRDLKNEEDEQQQERQETTAEAKEVKEDVVIMATSSSGSAAAVSEASVQPLSTSAVVVRHAIRSSGPEKGNADDAKSEGWVLRHDRSERGKDSGNENDDGDQGSGDDDDDEKRARTAGKVKTGSYVAPRKSTNPLRKTADEGSGIQRSQSLDTLGHKESSNQSITTKRFAGKDIDFKKVGRKMRKGLELKSHKHNLKRFENCFRGVQAVEWLMQGGHVESRPEAVEVCRRLLDEGDLFVNLPGLEADFADDDHSVYQFVV